MNSIKKNPKPFLFFVLVLVNVVIWLSFISLKPKNYVKVYFLNIGQGDSIYIESTNGNQILIDGGPDKSVLSELSSVMPKFDKTIDVVIETHPDKDHIGGLPEVIERFKVDYFLEPGVLSDNAIDDELLKRVEREEIKHFIARSGQVINLGDGSYLQILFPDRDVSGMETNDASVVARFVFGNTCFLLTGDSPGKIEEYLIGQYKEGLKCDVLKAGHHGSRTSTTEEYLHFVKPEFAVISAGENNSYGHPHQEVLERLNSAGVKVLKTSQSNGVKFKSDGEKIYPN